MTQQRRARVATTGDWLQRHPYLLPLVILLVGAAFRFYNLNWDDGHQLHPDERWIFEVLSGANNNPPLGWPTSWAQFTAVSDPTGGSPLNPHFFAYGSLPFYLLALLAGTVSWIGQHVPVLGAWAQINTYGNVAPFARGLSGVLDLISVALVFLLGRRLFGYWTGVVAMALTAFTVLDIQLSHFYTVDTVLLPLVLLTLLAAIQIAEGHGRAPYLWGAIAFGAALATKTTALVLVAPLLAAAVLGAWTRSPWPRQGGLLDRARRQYAAVAPVLNGNLQWLLTMYLLAAVAFVVFEPYAVLDRVQLYKDITSQTTFLVTNDPPFVVPFTIQYANTIPYLYQIKNMLFWTMGLPLALAAFAGLLRAIYRAARGRLHVGQWVLLCWIIPYFLFVGRFFAKFNRYMLPIMPLMTLFGAALLVTLLRSSGGRRRLVAGAALTVVLGGSFLYSLGYMNIYAHANTRVAASRWMFAHIPAGSHIMLESAWDDALPLDVDGHSGGATFQFTHIELYDGEMALADSDRKIAAITDALLHDQYIVITSERLTGSIPRLPLRFPIANRYYQLLFAGKLNFKLERVFQQHPRLGPFVVEDYGADESFHVYDHPFVRIFKRDGPITAGVVRHLLTTGLPNPGPGADYSALPAVLRPVHPIPDTRLMLTSQQWQKDQSGGTMSSMFPTGGLGMQHPIVVWLLLLELFGLIAFPLSSVLFGRLPDRGWVIAKTVGLLLVGYLVWMTVNFGIAEYTAALISALTTVLALISVVVAWKRWAVLTAWFRVHWRAALGGELVFLAGFALFILLRMWYPDLGHQFAPVSTASVGGGRMGEKQMELAFLNAIVRSRVFPPFDPFFAHGYINYYYYGFYLVGTLCKLSGIMPATGFNLAIATFFALLVGNAYSATLGLTRRIGPGVIAAVFVGLIGNLNGGWQLIQGLLGVATVHLSFPFFGGLVDAVNGLEQVIFYHQILPPFDFWGPTRIVPGGAISEFPFFTYLFADLHPHLMAFPLTVAALAVGVNLAQGGYCRWSGRVLAIVLGALILGSIAATNPWDYPTYILIIGLGALVGSYAVRRNWRPVTFLRPLLWMAIPTALSGLLYLPFKQSYQTVFSTGIGLVRNVTPEFLQNYPQFCPGGGTVCPDVAHDVLVTPLRIYLEHFGLLLFAALSYLVLLLAQRGELAPRARRAFDWLQFVVYYRDRLPRLRHAARVSRRMRGQREERLDLSLFAGMVVVLAIMLFLGYTLLAFLVAALALVSITLALAGPRLSPGRLFVLGLFGAGLLISLATQIFFFKDFLAGGPQFRMNTIFKFYNQIWVLFAIAGAASVYYFMCLQGEKGSTRSRRSPHIRAHRTTPGETGTAPGAPAFGFASHALALQPQSATPTSSSLNSTAFLSAEPVGGVVRAHVGEHFRRVRLRGRRGPLALINQTPLWSLALIVLLAGSFIYTYAGTVARETYRTTWLPESSVPFTLDGMAFMKVAYPQEYAAITWLNDTVAGAPVITEAPNTYYDWRSRVSMFTGLPTPMNGIHEGEQRYADELDPSLLCAATRVPDTCASSTRPRVDDVNTLYNSPNPADAWRVIHEFGVRYIYVGFSERQCDTADSQCYSRAGLAKFDRMVGHGLRIAYRNPGVTIYQVTTP